MDAYIVTPVSPFPAAIGAAFSTFTTRQDVSPQPLPIILPYALRVGSKLEIEADGEYSSLTGAALTLGFYIGTIAGSITTPIAESSIQTTGTTPAAWPWHMEYKGIVTALGASGSITGAGFMDFGTSLTASTRTPIPITLALRTFTIDTSLARAVGVSAVYGASSASNIVKTYDLRVLLIN